MPLYVFYPTRPNGVSLTFCAVHLENDVAAADYAEALLSEHPACDCVVAWRGERKVVLRRRRHAPADLAESTYVAAH